MERGKRKIKSTQRLIEDAEPCVPAGKGHWVIEEKKAFLTALLEHGPKNIEKLHEAVPTKTKQQIKLYIKYAKENGMWKPVKGDPVPSLEQWLSSSLLKPVESPSSLSMTQNIIPNFLTIIAETERHPPPHLCGGVDFKKLYHALAQAMSGEGLAGINLNGPSKNLLLKNLTWMNKLSTAKITSKYRNEIAKPRSKETPVDINGIKKEKLRFSFNGRTSWNPLNIPENLLKIDEEMMKHYPTDKEMNDFIANFKYETHVGPENVAIRTITNRMKLMVKQRMQQLRIRKRKRLITRQRQKLIARKKQKVASTSGHRKRRKTVATNSGHNEYTISSIPGTSGVSNCSGSSLIKCELSKKPTSSGSLHHTVGMVKSKERKKAVPTKVISNPGTSEEHVIFISYEV
jgi:hypothetical protein